MTQDASIIDIVQSYLAAEDLQLPVFDRTARELQAALSGGDYDIERCATLINQDQALASQLLREANSAFYRGLKEVKTIRDAIVRLGAEEVLNLTLLVTQRNHYRCAHAELRGLIEKLWKHSLGVALGAHWLARHAGYQNLRQEAFLAGLLHDIGRLFLLKVLDEMTSQQRLRQISEPLVMEILDSMHVDQGYRLMTRWALPETYCEVVRGHHQDPAAGGTTVLLLVQLANETCHKLGLSLHPPAETMLATTAQAQALDIGEITLAELEVMLEDRFFPDRASAAP